MEKGIARVLAVGDVVGRIGSEYLSERLWGLRRELKIDMAIVNGENSAQGNGIDRESAEMLLRGGADVITGGNHIYRKSAASSLLTDSENIIRPANYPAECPGVGYCIFDMCSYRVLVMNLLGTAFMESLDSPFTTADKILKREEGRYDMAFVDFHAEATGEKIALGRYLDGRVSGVFGTHTHVQTADEQIFKGGTGYITDLGMCGPTDSVLGVKSDIIIRRFLNKMPCRHEEAEGECALCGAVFTVDCSNGKCLGVERIKA